MTLLPIVERELRVAARGRGLFHARFWTAAACLGFAVYLFVVFGEDQTVLPPGRNFIFEALSYFGFLYCIGASRSTVDCISQEKREGTLGLLFLTDLKGYDVALGKLLANSLKSFNGLLGTLPIACCVLMMGGVSASEIWRVILALLNIFFFAHALGLLLSTSSRVASRAHAGAAMVLIFYFLLIPAAVAVLRENLFYQTGAILQLFDPGYAFRRASASGFLFSDYWISLAIVNLHAWFFLLAASLYLPHCWQDRPRDTHSTWRVRFRQWGFGPPQFRDALRQRLLNTNPFLWLISRNRLGQIAVWAMLGLILCGFFWAVSFTGWADSMPWFVILAIVNHGTLKFWIAAESSIHLEELRLSGALEYLLSCTPLSPAEIIHSQWLALRRRFLAPVVAVLVFDMALIFAIDTHLTNDNAEARTQCGIAIMAFMAMLVADAFAIGWMGMWRAMVAKRARQAAGQTAWRILVLPWLILGLMAPLGFFSSFYSTLLSWFYVGIAIDAGFASVARTNLYEQFRARAAVLPQERIGLFGRIGRALGLKLR